MSLWNPHAFTITGQPMAPAAPPALRVQGGTATPTQLAMAQAAFASFCTHARLSAVPNPTQIGRLPDGSPYRIVVVGNTAIMELQVTEGEGLPRRSGIGLSLTTLSGGLVPGHIHKDGLRPQPYILTPEVLPGTRKCTGKWRVRKVDGYAGGKAVWGNKAGSKFAAGVGGAIYDIDLLDYRSLDRIFGTNNRAYWAGEYEDGTHIYTDGEKILGAFRDRTDTLPFLRKRSSGELWIMQITPVFYPTAKLQLYGEKYSGDESTATIGDLLHELDIPDGYSLIWQTISVSPDGTNVRMMMRKVVGDAIFSKVDLSVSDDRLSIASMVDSGGYSTGSQEVISTGDQGPNSTYTRTEIDTPGWVRLPGGYGYDAKGNRTDFSIRQVLSGGPRDRRSHTVEVRTSSGTWGPGGYSIGTLDSSTESTETFHIGSLDYGDRVVTMDAGGQRSTMEFHEVTQNWQDPEAPGGARIHIRRTGTASGVREDGGAYVLFVDPVTDLYITSQALHEGRTTTVIDYTYVFPPGYPGGVTDNSTTTGTHSYGRRLVAMCKGAEVLRVETALSGPEYWTRVQYVASSATDPLTGAVCVNVLELDTLAGSNAPPLRSWIILADDKGAKLLHEVMDVPDTTDIRVRNDPTLLSVV